MELGFDSYTRLADSVSNSFVFAKGPALDVALSLGQSTPLFDGKILDLPGEPEHLMGYVYQVKDSEWSFVELEFAHTGVPQLYSDFMEDWVPVPYDPEVYYPDLDALARNLLIPDAPLSHLTPLTTAAQISKKTGFETVAIWCLEEFSIFGAAFLEEGKIKEVFSAYGMESYIHLTPTSQTECLGFLFDPLNTLLKEKGIKIPMDNTQNPYLHFEIADYDALVQINVTEPTSVEAWSDFIDCYRETLPV